MLAGAYIGLGAMFFTIVTTGSTMSYGVTRLLGGLAFSLGLILVVVAGAALFTGNNLMTMAALDRKISLLQLLRNWAVVYAGNFAGSIVLALIVFYSEQYKLSDGGVGVTAIKVANYKCGLHFLPAFMLGILCNFLVCLAVWLCYSGRSATDKILAIIFPITAFVAAGFEHSVANMYFISTGLFTKPAALLAQEGTPLYEMAKSATNLTWENFLAGNLIPVTLGNIVGGGLFVGAMYWAIYCRKCRN
jgi:formate/nitrite transporter